MDVDFITIAENKTNANERIVKAGKYKNNKDFEEDILCEFMINISKTNNNQYDAFRKKVENYKNCMLSLGNNETIKYNFNESSVTFKTDKIYVKLIQVNAPELMCEMLLNFFY